jgi:hypothetical protein
LATVALVSRADMTGNQLGASAEHETMSPTVSPTGQF